MSCVTKTTVLRSSCWRRRNSSWSRARTIGSIAPNGSSINISGGVGAERAREADALALTTGKLRGEPLRVGRIEPDELEQLRGARLDPRAWPAEQLRHRADVRLHRHVREEAHLLDDVADRAAQLCHVVVADLPV